MPPAPFTTTLNAAARDGDLGALRRLARRTPRFDADALDEVGWAALHRAAMHDRLDALRVLVAELGADVETRDDDGWTALRRAERRLRPLVLAFCVLQEDDTIAAKIIDDGLRLSEFGRARRHRAAWVGRPGALRCLVEELGADVHAARGAGAGRA